MTPRGRPRSFDRDAALERATRLFWERGYDGTSIADLTAALGIAAPSLYAAFGDKRALFAEAVDHYRDEYALHIADDSSARAHVEGLLNAAVVAYTDPRTPRGCLVLSAVTTCSAESADVEQKLAAMREANVAGLRRRIAADVRAGRLPAGTDARGLAAFYASVLQGMSLRSRDGASRRELAAIAATAMCAWPG